MKLASLDSMLISVHKRSCHTRGEARHMANWPGLIDLLYTNVKIFSFLTPVTSVHHNRISWTRVSLVSFAAARAGVTGSVTWLRPERLRNRVWQRKTYVNILKVLGHPRWKNLCNPSNSYKTKENLRGFYTEVNRKFLQIFTERSV